MQSARTRVVLVTGLSGAGRSSALRALEDMGYEAVDNVPLSLLPNLVQPVPDMPDPGSAIAIGVDSRTRAFDAAAFDALLSQLRERSDLEPLVLFLDASDQVLIRRYTETRRRHPLAIDRPVQDGIDSERRLMVRARDRADILMDTSELSVRDLRRLLEKQFSLEANPGLALTVTSFSYRRGLPRDADLVIDVRFLTNPFYDSSLRDLSGLDPAVGTYIAADPEFETFFRQLSDLVLTLLPNYQREGKAYLTIAFGCTGGRHRSVYVAERAAKVLREKGFPVTLAHRDIEGDFAGPTGGNTSG